MYEGVIGALRHNNLKPEVKHRLLHSAMDILKKSAQDDASLKLSHVTEIRAFVADLRKSNDKGYQEIAQQFMASFTDRK